MASTAAKFGVPHCLHAVLLANWWSPQLLQNQSPGFMLPPFLPFPDPPPLGFAVPHLRHTSFLANCKSLQLGQCQSPGFSETPPPASSADVSGSGFGVPHLRHLVFLANWRSPQPGQYQSPGFSMAPPNPAANPASKAALLASGSGFAVPHFRHSAFFAN
eukprot:CAMPEP_0169109416 /NCGR_PEP_ID=MMETSP1015-20121227/25953_1 /TAXON_ID=342587 /ORGANISM="Karlodinium micrum, Strain CCMP2283" /LENGTH=159 /DNA_ID=CAMNT_0009171111 /DNA_START=92 /DNA_END=571 /DNA_ORIENTATION=+